jgi:hypothetical protein
LLLEHAQLNNIYTQFRHTRNGFDLATLDIDHRIRDIEVQLVYYQEAMTTQVDRGSTQIMTQLNKHLNTIVNTATDAKSQITDFFYTSMEDYMNQFHKSLSNLVQSINIEVQQKFSTEYKDIHTKTEDTMEQNIQEIYKVTDQVMQNIAEQKNNAQKPPQSSPI